MNNKFIKILSIAIFIIFSIPCFVGAQGTTYNFDEQSGLNKTGNSAGYPTTTKTDFIAITSVIIREILTLLGVVFLGLMVYGGLSWMTAEGNDTKVEKARGIIVAGIVGFIVIAAAYGLSYAVISFFAEKTIL